MPVEEALGARLDGLVGHGVGELHDRRIPRTMANVAHIAVAPSDVYVIDAKIGGAFTVDDIAALGSKKATQLFVSEGPLEPPIVESIHQALATAFRMA